MEIEDEYIPSIEILSRIIHDLPDDNKFKKEFIILFRKALKLYLVADNGTLFHFHTAIEGIQESSEILDECSNIIIDDEFSGEDLDILKGLTNRINSEQDPLNN
jgi:hypothetical protein